MDALTIFRQYEERNGTHLNRFLMVLKRQIKNQNDFVSLFAKYPANSTEFKTETEKLFNELSDIALDFKETVDCMIDDGSLLKEVLVAMKIDIDKLPEDWGKEQK